MARQDIFATLSDDVLGDRCSSSSTRGKVNRIELWVNTDKFGNGMLTCKVLRDDKENPTGIKCWHNFPDEWGLK